MWMRASLPRRPTGSGPNDHELRPRYVSRVPTSPRPETDLTTKSAAVSLKAGLALMMVAVPSPPRGAAPPGSRILPLRRRR
jgi:hypothetical protein